MLRLNIFLTAVLCVACANVTAETLYISDDIRTPMRSGPSVENKILKMLKAGTPVERVEASDPSTGYTAVEHGGQLGWVFTRELSKTPGAGQRLAVASKELEALKSEHAELSQKLEEVSGSNSQQVAQITELRNENERLSVALDTLRKDTANVVTISERNKALEKELFELRKQHDILVQENNVLADKTAKDWFIRGAGVVLVGILLGLILPRLRIKRRDSWGDGFR